MMKPAAKMIAKPMIKTEVQRPGNGTAPTGGKMYQEGGKDSLRLPARIIGGTVAAYQLTAVKPAAKMNRLVVEAEVRTLGLGRLLLRVDFR